MPPVGFEPAIPTSEKPQSHALDRAATWTGSINVNKTRIRTGFLVHDVKAFRGRKEGLHTFFISTQDRHEWTLSPLCTWGKKISPLFIRWGSGWVPEIQSHSGQFGV